MFVLTTNMQRGEIALCLYLAQTSTICTRLVPSTNEQTIHTTLVLGTNIKAMHTTLIISTKKQTIPALSTNTQTFRTKLVFKIPNP